MLINLFIISYVGDTVINCESVEGLQNSLERFEDYCNV